MPLSLADPIIRLAPAGADGQPAAAPDGWPRSWYAASVDIPPPHPPLRADRRCDVVVVGGGYTGLAAALTLAEAGIDVVLLEAQRLGWGASGRNGGHVGLGYVWEPAGLRARFGAEHTQAMVDIATQARGWLIDRVERHRIDCDLTWGYLHAATKPRQMRVLQETLDDLPDAWRTPETRLLDRQALSAELSSPFYVGALRDPLSGHLHPLAYALGLARAAAAAGAALHEGTGAVEVTPGRPVRVRTTTGVTVTAEACILATNAYGPALSPSTRARIMPTGTYMIATEPLGANRARALIPNNRAVADLNFVLNYFRFSRDHRLLFGGGVNYTGIERLDRPHALRSTMAAVFPDLRHARIDYGWSGFVAITISRLPDIGRAGDGVVYAQGYSGHGVMLSGKVGAILGDAVRGHLSQFDVLSRIPHRVFPGGRLLRTPSLVAAMAWYRLRDLI